MITLYTGTPGSGKSYHVILLMLAVLRSGRKVISNFPIKFTEKEKKKGYHLRFTYMGNDDLTVESLLRYSILQGMYEARKESQCLVVIDEAGGKFNCRLFASKDRQGWLEFFSQHRKLGFDFILVSQNDRMLDKQIRQLVEYEKIHRKINRLWLFEYLPFTIFISVEHWYVIKQRLGCEFIWFRKSVSERYDSMKLFESFRLDEKLLEKLRLPDAKVPEDFKVTVKAIYTQSDD